MVILYNQPKAYRLYKALHIQMSPIISGHMHMLWSLGVREVVGSCPGRGNSKESFSSYQETGKVFSPEMPFYSTL